MGGAATTTTDALPFDVIDLTPTTIANYRQPPPIDRPSAVSNLPAGGRVAARAQLLQQRAPDFTQGVDTLPNRDRCLMAANAAAPPMTSQGYNDAYQIVQTPTVIVISVEMMRETRIIPLFASAEEARRSHGPKVLQRWTGDSVGWWEGDTLVVETINVKRAQASQSPYPTSPDAIARERFTRTARNALGYQAEIIDPATYTRPWTVSYAFKPANRSRDQARP